MADATQVAAVVGRPVSLAPLMRLPNEILFAVADLLNPGSMARLMASSRFLYQLLVDRLYRADADARGTVQEGGGCSCCSAALRWGCRTSNTDTIRRAVPFCGVGVGPRSHSWPHVLAMALDSSTPSPLATLSCLLEHGLPANVVSLSNQPGDGEPTFWPILAAILEAATRPPRWCPLPVVAAFLRHGGTLPTTSGDIASDVWYRVQALVQVRGPRQWRWPRSVSLEPTLRHDHCLHDAVPCNVALTRLLLERGRADPSIVFASPTAEDNSLLVRFLQDPRRPVELLRCLLDAGSDAGRMISHNNNGQPRLHGILEDAVRQSSFAVYPRRRAWDCYPVALVYEKAADIVRFLLSRGLPGVDLGGRDAASKRTLWLLDRWDPQWQRMYRQVGQQARKRKRKNPGGEGQGGKRRKVDMDQPTGEERRGTASRVVGPTYVKP